MHTFIFDEQPGRTAISNGKEYLFFSGYSYLGMSHVPEFNVLLQEGLRKFGPLFPSSRISNTRLALFEECEQLLSSITGFEETVLVSSGFIAGKLSTEFWQQPLQYPANAHPAIRPRFGNLQSSKENIVATDSINILDATVNDFSFYKPETGFCIVDDSHGFGLLGANGEGIASSVPFTKDKCMITYSLSKACNIIAGAISCSKDLARKLRAMPEYTAATAPSPAFLYAFIRAQELYTAQRKKLDQNIRHFRSLIGATENISSPNGLPIFILPSSISELELAEAGIIISSFAYPDPNGKKIQRIVLNALHTPGDLEKLASCLNTIL